MKVNKKFLAFLPLTFSGVALISCTQVYSFYKLDKPINESPKFFANKDYENLFNSVYFNNNSIRQNKLIQQLNIDPVKAEVELKYSLAISRPFFPLHEANGYSILAKDSNYTINNYLTKNWFFLLNNIDKINFIYNPYSTRLDKYKASDGSPQYLKNALINGGELEKESESAQSVIKIKNKKFQFIKIDKDQSLLPGNTTYYLVFEGNKFIRMTTFIDDSGQPQVRLDYNLFLLKDSNQNPDPFLFANEIESWINQKEQNYLKSKINDKKENLEDSFNDVKENLESKISKFKSDLDDLDSSDNLDDTDSNGNSDDSGSSQKQIKSSDDESNDNSGSVNSNDSDDVDEDSDGDGQENSEAKQKEWLAKLTRKPSFGLGGLSSKSSDKTQSLEPKLDPNATTEQKKEFYESQIKSLETQLQQKKAQHEKDLENVDKLAAQDFAAEKKQINQSNFFTDITSNIAELNTNFKFAKYSLASIDLDVPIQNLQNSNKNKGNTNSNSSKKDYYYQFYKKYIDPNLNVTTDKETPDERATKSIFKDILNLAWGHNEAGKVEFLNQQNNPEYVKNLEQEWKKISDNLGTPNNINEQAFELYKNFVKENWYFILKRIGKLELIFKNWYSFPDQEYNGQKIAHSEAFKEKVADESPISDVIIYANPYLESISEGDTSRLSDKFKDLYILKQNSLINIRIDTYDDKPKVTLNPLILYFQKPRNKISVKVLTEIFHQALYHYSQEAYNSFENDFVDKFRYGLPAQMVLKEQNEKNS
ncbi:aromatic motif membrane protein [Mesomycoplasma bovoculi]|uniref:Putative lipoprotein n=1 Tax=Mesomycoplasma bovoculi M165/69 TaxID=743966 RepID=W5UZU7_9BACT|nr:aromatic motif membrane protein [Mesomycoplasma bovoculi]AHH45063.1 putative lipoprotein [Mesomycoplasma bovoculi M165/69]